MKKALICVPTYNEKDNVAPLAEAIFQNVPENTELLFVDDGSPDGTGELLDAMAAKNPRIHVLHRKGKLGLATAYLRAFEWGLAKDFDWFFEMDADFSHNPVHLNDFFQIIHDNQADVICGSRYVMGGGVSNWSKGRLLLSRAGSVYAKLWLEWNMKDATGGFNAWSREVLESIVLSSVSSKGYAFQIEMKYRAYVKGFRILETPIVFQERRAGQSKMSGSIVSEAIVGVAKLRLNFETRHLF